jgi:hypothetical protein
MKGYRDLETHYAQFHYIREQEIATPSALGALEMPESHRKYNYTF